MIKQDDIKIILQSTPSEDKWRQTGFKRRAGIVVPLFSVYSQKSIGIGDLGDLKLLIDWAEDTGNSIIQLLPMNETGSTFCPYDALSSFALEPAYICLEEIPGADSNVIKRDIKQLRQLFPAGKKHIDYRIKKAKLGLLFDIFKLGISQKDNSFELFRKENSYWLEDFAAFKVLKEYHSGKPWYEWEGSFWSRSKPQLREFINLHENEINFQVWLQWLLFEQFKRVKEYAVSKSMLLKGDLPILVSRDSADVWSHTDFFQLEYSAGAPPDMYCAKGQRWGMPTYNWEKKAVDEYKYLKERLKFAQNFYDILRIDHVVGLFRIWSIPYEEPIENQGLNGFFDPPDEGKWREHGKNILSVILNNTKMLLCAEDLGVIPAACTETLNELGVPGNDVQRWVKDWKVKHDFLIPQDYRFLSVAMLSTHDTTDWMAWWNYEADTVDDALFMRRCAGRIDYADIKQKLFDPIISCHGRLRWFDSINSVDKLLLILGKPREEVLDFVEMYENTFREKEKLWKAMELDGVMRDDCDSEILEAALKLTYQSNSIFCIQLITDILGLADDIEKSDPFQYRINTPGTVSDKNWSLVFPIALEDLLKHPICRKIKSLIVDSGRI